MTLAAARRVCLAVFCSLLLGLSLIVPNVASARPAAVSPFYTVDSLTDSGTGSGTSGDLRYVLKQIFRGGGDMPQSAPNPVVTFVVSGTIGLFSPLPTFGGAITLNGPGVNALTIYETGIYPVFAINPGGPVTISGMTIANGAGAITNTGDLTITNSAFTGNSSAISNTGTLSVSHTSFTSNSSTFGSGAAIANDGGTVAISDSVFTNNTIPQLWGGAILNSGSPHIGTMAISRSTFSGNSAVQWGNAIANSGIMMIAASTFVDAGPRSDIYSDGTLTMSATTIVGSCIDAIGTTYIQNSIVSNGCGGGVATGDHNLGAYCPGTLGAVTGLSATLADNGDTTQTLALLPGSNAIDAAASCNYPAAFTLSIFD